MPYCRGTLIDARKQPLKLQYFVLAIVALLLNITSVNIACSFLVDAIKKAIRLLDGYLCHLPFLAR